MFRNRDHVKELDAADVQALLARGDVTLVDVREPAEHRAERIDGAVCMPLSRFDPDGLPRDAAAVVIHCLSGKRSLAAAEQCRQAGMTDVSSMRGGILAWKAAGLPTRRG